MRVQNLNIYNYGLKFKIKANVLRPKIRVLILNFWGFEIKVLGSKIWA